MAAMRPAKEYLMQAQDTYSDQVLFEALHHKNQDHDFCSGPGKLKHVWVVVDRSVVRKIMKKARKTKPEAKIRVFCRSQGDRTDTRECTAEFTHPTYKFPAKVLLLRKNIRELRS